MKLHNTILAALFASLACLAASSPITDNAPLAESTGGELDYDIESMNVTVVYGDVSEEEINELVKRQDTTVVNCRSGPRPSTLRLGFRTFIDNIPNTVYDLRNPAHGLPYGLGTTFRGRSMVANIYRRCSTCGTIASGGNIRHMLHRGFAECVLTGRNNVGSSTETFYNYQVYNPGYRIEAGGGVQAGYFGTEGTPIDIRPPQ